jgi:DNA (cytosine-5)-methyltransferase 1
MGAEPERHSKEWIAADTDGIRLQQCEDTTKMGTGQSEMGRQGREFTDAIETDGKVADAADTDLHGCNERNGKHEEQSGERGVNAQRDIEQSHVDGDTADTHGTNCKTWTHRKILGKPYRQKTDGFGYVECRSQWQNFPTVSPICYGDDGISNRLDSITFSKWRNESIKAGGNAVVPQVVYQIFKAIQEYENMHK